MPSFGSTATEPKNRSGWSRMARSASSLPGPTLIMPRSMPKRSRLSSTTATGSTLSSRSAGTSLNMYCAGNENSLLSASRRCGARNLYTSLRCWLGNPRKVSITGTPDGMVIVGY
jgi:hypothetical protein